MDGNLFDPFNGKKDIEIGQVSFIGDAEKRIKEDYLRILRYLRFFLNYSKQPHNEEVRKIIKRNINGISLISKERLLDELKKLLKSNQLEKLSKDRLSIDLILLIFPELKNLRSVIDTIEVKKKLFVELDLMFVLFLMIIDETDNLEYFLYKYNISKKEQKRAKIISKFYNEKKESKILNEVNLNKVLYYNGKQAVLDILNFKIIKTKKVDKKLLNLLELFKSKAMPSLPIGANLLMTRYQIPEGKQIGSMLKLIEEEWIRNNFEISNKQIDNIVKG